MLGKKFLKKNLDVEVYRRAADWCNVNGAMAMIEDKGEYYEVVAIPEPSVEEVKAAKLLELKDWTAAAITGGFVSAGIRYDSDKDTQVTMQGIALSVNTPRFAEEYPNGAPVRGYDKGAVEKTVHWLDADGILLFCQDLSAHIGYCKMIGWKLQQAVAEAKTVDDLQAIKWPEGA